MFAAQLCRYSVPLQTFKNDRHLEPTYSYLLNLIRHARSECFH